MGNVCVCYDMTEVKLVEYAGNDRVRDLSDVLSLGVVDINCKVDGITALYNACFNDCPEVVRYLCQTEGLDINMPCVVDEKFRTHSVNFKGCINEVFGVIWSTPLMVAVGEGSLQCVEILLKHRDIDVNSGSFFEKKGQTYIKESEMVQIDSPESMCDVGEIGELTPYESPLFLAILSGNTSMAELLLSSEPKIDPNIGSAREGSCIRQAINSNQFGIFESIMRIGNVNLNLDENEWRRPILTQLCAKLTHGEDMIKKIELCLKKMIIDLKGEKSSNPLFHAIELKRADLLHLLVSHPKIEINSLLHGKTALCHACEKLEDDSLRLIQMLLNHPKIDVNLRSSGYGSPIWISSKLGKTFIVKELLFGMKEKGNVIVEVDDVFEGQTALEVTSDENIKEFILKYKQ